MSDPEQQTLLFDQEFDERASMTIDDRFWEFHAKHPEVYDKFEKIARQVRNAGRTHYSAKIIIERVRHETNAGAKGSREFKINNSYTSRYARHLVEEHPEFKGFFEFRELTAA